MTGAVTARRITMSPSHINRFTVGDRVQWKPISIADSNTCDGTIKSVGAAAVAVAWDDGEIGLFWDTSRIHIKTK